MSKGAIIMIILGLIVIIKPEIIAYVLGITLIILGGSFLYANTKFKSKNADNNYFKFGEYKIYKNHKD